LHLPLERFTTRSDAIAISAYPTCIPRPRRNIAMPFGIAKLEWFGYPMMKKF